MPSQWFTTLRQRTTPPVAGLTLLSFVLATYPAVGLPASPRPIRTSAVVRDAYTLGAGDRIRVDIFRVPQYSGETEVQIDGTLNLPLAGTVPVSGLTIEQATAAISAAYSRFLRRPVVTLSLITRRAMQIGVAGEVLSPGSYTAAIQGVQYPTLTQLIKTAGGITLSADVRQIELRRAQPNGIDQVMAIDLWQLVKTGDLRYDITLRDGDSIYVPTVKTIDLAEMPQLAATSFTADMTKPINIAVSGEVFRQGSWTVTGGSARTSEQAGRPGNSAAGGIPTVTRALQVAGGIKPLADIRSVEIRRPTRTGEELVFKVNLWDLLQEGDLNQDTILQEGDMVIVPSAPALDLTNATEVGAASFSPDRIRVNVVGEVISPGVIELPPNTPLDKAVLAAGGFNRRASRNTVELVRLDANGSGERKTYPLNFGGDLGDNNPPLQNNDVIIVRRSGLASFTDTIGTIISPLGGLFSLFDVPTRIIRILNND